MFLLRFECVCTTHAFGHCEIASLAVFWKKSAHKHKQSRTCSDFLADLIPTKVSRDAILSQRNCAGENSDFSGVNKEIRNVLYLQVSRTVSKLRAQYYCIKLLLKVSFAIRISIFFSFPFFFCLFREYKIFTERV